MCRLLDNFENTGQKVWAKFQYIKTVSSNVVAQSIMPFELYQYIGRVTTTSPELLAASDLPLLKAASFDNFCLVAPQQ